MSHFITKCSCGEVISQCRCFSADKTVTVIEKGCEKCKTLPQAHLGAVERMEDWSPLVVVRSSVTDVT